MADYGEAKRRHAKYYLDILRECHELYKQGNICWKTGELERAIKLQEQRLAIARQYRNHKEEYRASGSLGWSRQRLGDTGKARDFYQQQLEAARQLGDDASVDDALNNLKSLATLTGT